MSRKSILEMDEDEARAFLIKPTSYVPFALPEYFNFARVLADAKKCFKQGNDIHTFGGKNMKFYQNLNHVMFMNKDGNYDWRPITIVHPLAYIGLVYYITKKENWEIIKRRFKEFQKNDRIKCISIPVESTGKKNDKEETILNWWENLEQATIKYALSYQYCIKTDITNCYGSIYTHTIDWALEGKNNAKENMRNNSKTFGYKLDERIREVQYGQTNGILQGGEVYNLIAEIVMGYADELMGEQLPKSLSSNEMHDYQIIRYRDDYRIFSNSKETAEKIIKVLAEILTGLNMHFNQKKTSITSNLIKAAIKPDKFFWTSRKESIQIKINNTVRYQLSLQKHLWLIKELSDKFPNSGSLTIALSDFYKRIKKEKVDENQIPQLISILSDLIVNSPKSIANEVIILSRIFAKLSEDRVKHYMDLIQGKVSRRANTEYTEIWLQRLAIMVNYKYTYKSNLAKKVENNSVKIWDSEWYKGGVDFSEDYLINSDKINNLNMAIPEENILLFNNRY